MIVTQVVIIISMVIITIAFIKSLTKRPVMHTPITLQNLETIAKLVTNDGGHAAVVKDTLHILYKERILVSVKKVEQGVIVSLGKNDKEEVPLTREHKRIVKYLSKLLRKTEHTDCLPIIIKAAAYAANLEKKK